MQNYLIVIFPFSHFNLHALFALSFSIHITESQFLSFDNDDMKPSKRQVSFTLVIFVLKCISKSMLIIIFVHKVQILSLV